MRSLDKSTLHGFPMGRHGFVAYNGVDLGKLGQEDALDQSARFVSCLAGCGLKFVACTRSIGTSPRILQCVLVTGASDPLVLTLLVHIRVTARTRPMGLDPRCFGVCSPTSVGTASCSG